jgi:hypothetical protein
MIARESPLTMISFFAALPTDEMLSLLRKIAEELK